MPKIELDIAIDRKLRRGSGKRSLTKTDLKQGRYVRSIIPKNKFLDLAFDATLRAAAPFQKSRALNKVSGCFFDIRKEDLRQKVREKRVGNTFLFLVDASGSMGAKERMRAVKGAIFYMLQEAYQKRDRVGMIAFRRDKAEILLPITRSVDLAQKCLQTMPTGGKTPLAAGLNAASEMLYLQNKRDSDLEPVLILITDGRANSASENLNPVEAAIQAAKCLAEQQIKILVIDTETDFIKVGITRKIAQEMGATYYQINKLSQESVLKIVRNIL